jgi:hypothetical protein
VDLGYLTFLSLMELNCGYFVAITAPLFRTENLKDGKTKCPRILKPG